MTQITVEEFLNLFNKEQKPVMILVNLGKSYEIIDDDGKVITRMVPEVYKPS